MDQQRIEEENEKKWTLFLSSIEIVLARHAEPISFNIEGGNKQYLAHEFADKLLEDKTEQKLLQEQEKNAKRLADVGIDFLMRPSPVLNPKQKSLKQKPDVDKPCSSWTVGMIAKYFDFDKTVEIHEILTGLNPVVVEYCRQNQWDLELSSIVSDVKQKLKVVKPLKPDGFNLEMKGFKSDLQSITANECGCRLILDAFLFRLCFSLKLNIEVEKNIKCKDLPNCRFDYCLSKGDKIIGCVEAKSIKGFVKDSVAQALMELMVLQAHLIHIDTRYSKCSLFAILTDGHRFIYIQLIESVFKFEVDHETVKIHKITNESDFEFILKQIIYLTYTVATGYDIIERSLASEFH